LTLAHSIGHGKNDRRLEGAVFHLDTFSHYNALVESLDSEDYSIDSRSSVSTRSERDGSGSSKHSFPGKGVARH
jgi:hypothetical protein